MLYLRIQILERREQHWSTLIGTWGKVKRMQLIHAVDMHDRRFECIYVDNLNRWRKENLFTVNWGCCGQVRKRYTREARAREEKHHSRHSLRSRRSVTECLWILSLPLYRHHRTHRNQHRSDHSRCAHKHTHDESTWPLISTNVRIADRNAPITFSRTHRCVSSRKCLPSRINAREKKKGTIRVRAVYLMTRIVSRHLSSSTWRAVNFSHASARFTTNVDR